MAWIVGGLVLFAIVAGVALQFAISRNGPAVLSTVDRLAGGNRGAELKATIATGTHPQQKVLIWGPERRDPAGAPLPVLVFAHGGSWRSGDPVDYGFIGRAFVPNGFIVVLVGYRLGEDGKYPAMLEDTASAIAWTHEEIAAYGGDPDRIVVAGHSAGAYNVVTTTLDQQWLARKGMSANDLSGVIGMSGPYDFFPFDSDSTIAAFGDADDPVATQPVTHIRGDAPPMLLIHGEKDTLVYPRNTRALADALTDAGGDVATHFYPDMEHNDPLVSIAAPWRSRRGVLELMADFAHVVTKRSDRTEQTSVPVHAETR